MQNSKNYGVGGSEHGDWEYLLAILHIKDDTEWMLFNNGSRRNKTEEMTKEDMAGRKKYKF